MREYHPQDLLRHRAFVRGLALSLTGEAEAAEDLTQETLLIGLERPPVDAGALRGWLAQVVRRLAWRRFRADRARADRERRAHAATGEALELPASSDAAQTETRLLLAQALEALEPIYRDVLVLRFYEGLSPSAIAERMGVPLETVRTRQKRGLERMRAKLDGRFRDREVWSLALLGLAGLAPRRPGALGWVTAAAVTAALLPMAWWGLRARAAPDTPVALAPVPTPEDARALDALAPPPSAERLGLAAEPTAPQPVEVVSPARAGRVWTPLGEPAAGARVLFQWPAGAARERLELTTDAQGRFEVPADARAAVVCAWHDDWGTAGMLSAKDPAFDDAFELALFHPWPHAAGSVLDEQGAPIPLARVTLVVAPDVGRTIAPRRWGVVLPEPIAVAEDGSFAVPSVPLGTYRIRAEAPGFAPSAQVWTPVESATRFEFVLERGRAVEGRLALRDGRPAAGARVEIDAGWPHAPAVALADADGGFTLENLPRGTLRAVASWGDGEAGWLAVGELSCGAGGRVRWDAELTPGGAIRGWAVRADEGLPLGWRVRAVTGARGTPGERVREVALDEFGAFLITGWDADHARVELRDSARALRALATWTAGMPDVELIEAPGRLVGQVRFDDPRQARDALLLVRHVETDDELEARLDVERGRLELDGLASGEWRLLRWLPGRRAEEVARYAVRAGETTDFGTLALPALAHLSVDVGGERGGHVRLLRRLSDGSWWPEQERRVSQADADGFLSFEVQPAAYEVRIGGITEALHSYNVILAPGARERLVPPRRELVDCRLRVRRPSQGEDGGMLDLRVLDPGLGIEVLLQRRPMRATTPRTVEFEVALPPGEWLLRASSPRGRVERHFRTEELDGDVAFELEPLD